MKTNGRDLPLGLPTAAEPPCLSLYQPTHRQHPDNAQDPIRFGNLVKSLEQSLRRTYPSRDVEALLEPFHALAGNRGFWNRTLDGLAVLGAHGVFRIFRLQRRVPELAIVADSFHTKPLLRTLQSADRYQVLGLNRRTVRLFEGDRYHLDEIEPAPGVPRTIDEAAGLVPDDNETAIAQPYDHGATGDAADQHAERYFRAVDRAVLEHHSRPSDLPLLLAALPEYHGMFRKLSRNPYLLDGGIEIHPDDLTLDELRERAWQVLEPHYRTRLSALADAFGSATPKGLGTDQLAPAAAAAATGRVATLLIEDDYRVPGRIDPATGHILRREDLSDAQTDDMLDDLGELVLNTGGEVLIVSPERMPTKTGVAAIYRY